MLKPTGNRLIVTEQLETLSSVIQIPDTVRKEREQLCTVVAVGPKVKDIAVGQTVLAAIWGGTPVEDKGKTLRLIDDGSILARVDPQVEEQPPEPPMAPSELIKIPVDTISKSWWSRGARRNPRA